MVRLRPMSPTELDVLLERLTPDYAADHVRSGQWDEGDAVARSRREIARLVPEGVRTPNQFLRTIVDDSGDQRVGEVWYALQTMERVRPQVFVYWLGIDLPFRRRGYAAQVLRWMEDEARRLGADRIALHVFADNTGAQALYAREGYVSTNVLMAKALGP